MGPSSLKFLLCHQSPSSTDATSLLFLLSHSLPFVLLPQSYLRCTPARCFCHASFSQHSSDFSLPLDESPPSPHRRRPFPEGWTHALSFNLGSRHWPFPLLSLWPCRHFSAYWQCLLTPPTPATHRFAWFEKGLPDGYISSSVFPV